MRWSRIAVLALVAGLALWAPATVTAKKPRQKAAEAQTQFGLDMYKVMADSDKTNNMLFSPLSICTALAMTYAGSNGETTRQMAEVLHYNQRRSAVMRGHRALLRRLVDRYGNDVILRMTNRLYVARRLRMRTRYSRYMDRMFGASIKQAAFNRPVQTARMINRKVQEDTNGAIESLIEPRMLSTQTRLVLVNAVYFKGDWLSKFNPANTVPGTFQALGGPRKVEMMQINHPFPVGRLPSLKARVLLLPYQGKKVHMMIILPRRRDGMQNLERGLAKTTLSEVFSAAKQPSQALTVKLPKFKLDERIDLKRVLHTMGMTDLFDVAKANLTRISRRGNLYVTDAVHKAVIDVNEEGSEASAATGISLGFRSGPQIPPFVVDRPFFFALYDAGSDLTLFMGRVMDPTA